CSCVAICALMSTRPKPHHFGSCGRSLSYFKTSTTLADFERHGIPKSVRFLRRYEHGRGQAPSFGGVAETFDARNRGAQVPAPAALVLDRKKLAAFSAAAARFLRFPIGDRRCNRTRASVGNAGGNARPSLTNATLAASRLLHRGAFSALGGVRHAILELFARLPPQRCRIVKNGFALAGRGAYAIRALRHLCLGIGSPWNPGTLGAFFLLFAKTRNPPSS